MKKKDTFSCIRLKYWIFSQKENKQHHASLPVKLAYSCVTKVCCCNWSTNLIISVQYNLISFLHVFLMQPEKEKDWFTFFSLRWLMNLSVSYVMSAFFFFLSWSVTVIFFFIQVKGEILVFSANESVNIFSLTFHVFMSNLFPPSLQSICITLRW